jgi:hypothetical protein
MITLQQYKKNATSPIVIDTDGVKNKSSKYMRKKIVHAACRMVVPYID